MKNKKIVIALFAFAVILLGGMTVGVLQGIMPVENTYNVVIRYNTLDSEENPTLYKTYSEEYAEGEQINIVSPKIEGYMPNKEKVSAVVNSDLFITVNYECLHLADLSKFVVKEAAYDASTDQFINGTLRTECNVCGYQNDEVYTKISRSVYFGGEEALSLVYGYTSDGYGYSEDHNRIYATASVLPELDAIFDIGIFENDTDYQLVDNLTFDVEYDVNVWGENAFTCKRSVRDYVYSPYFLRLGNSWRVLFGCSNESLYYWFSQADCPLKYSPIEITLTYDFSN